MTLAFNTFALILMMAIPGHSISTLLSSSATKDCFRFYKPSTGEHFITSNYDEGVKAGYNYEGVAFKSFVTLPQNGKASELYRCFWPEAGRHFVSVDVNCEGKHQEGSLGFIYDQQILITVPLYRFYNDISKDCLITTNYNEGIHAGYKLQGVLGYVPSENKSISANILGSPLIMTATSRLAGAIGSLKWKDKEFINSDDHGRELQSASSFDGLGECFNPTEAGSDNYPGSHGVTAGDGAGNTSTSVLLSLGASDNRLITKTQMAFWTPAGQPYTINGGCGGNSQFTVAQNTTNLSNHILDKAVTIGFAGISNVIEYLVTFHVAENHRSAVFEALTGYMPTDFSTFWTFDPASGALAPLSHGPGEQNIPIVFSTADKNYAMGIYSPDLPQPAFKNVGYGRFDFSAAPKSPVMKWNAVFRNGSTPAGDYGFRLYVVVGTLNDVEKGMVAVYQYFRSAK